MQANKVNVKDHAKLTEQADATKVQQAEQLQQLNQPTIMAAQAQPQDNQAEYERAAGQDTAQQDITQQDKALQDKAQQKLKKKKKTAEQDQTTAEDADAAQADDEAGEEASEETSAETTVQHQQQNSRHESDDLTHQHGNTRAAAHGPDAEAAGAEGTREVAGERANTEAALPWGSATAAPTVSATPHGISGWALAGMALAGLGAAAGVVGGRGGSHKDSGTTVVPPLPEVSKTTISGVIMAGPVLAKAGLSVNAYALDGRLLGSGTVNDDGEYLVILPSDYHGPARVRLIDGNGSGHDYMDEATHASKDVGAYALAGHDAQAFDTERLFAILEAILHVAQFPFTA